MTMSTLILQKAERALQAGVDVKCMSSWGLGVTTEINGFPAFAAGDVVDPLGACLLDYFPDGTPVRCGLDLVREQWNNEVELFFIDTFCNVYCVTPQWVLGFVAAFDGEQSVAGMLYRYERQQYTEGYEVGRTVKRWLPELRDAIYTVKAITGA